MRMDASYAQPLQFERVAASSTESSCKLHIGASLVQINKHPLTRAAPYTPMKAGPRVDVALLPLNRGEATRM